MPETILFHLGAHRDGVLGDLAQHENRQFLASQALCRLEPDIPFAKQLRELLARRPETSPACLPLDEPSIKEFRLRLENIAKASTPRILYLPFALYLRRRQALPLVLAITRDVFPTAGHKAFFSLVRQDINLMVDCRHAAFFKRDARRERVWLKAQAQKREQYAYAPALRELFALFGRDDVECHVSDSPSDAPEGMRRAALLAQEAFWRFAGIRVPPDPQTGLACFPPRLELCLPPEFHAFSRCCNALNPPKPPPFSSPWAEQSLRFADQGPFFTSFSPRERAAFVADFEEDNARAAKLLGRERLFAPVDEEQPWEDFSGLTEETARAAAERLERDFALAQRAAFDADPAHYLDREQRLCRQALHDALDPPSSGPPPARLRVEPKCSVLTLTYNQSAYIAECMESVITQQTNFSIQHIIADDGSDDGTQDIILDYAVKYPHIVPVFQKKRSYGPANIYALFDMARTEYVALCDGDDYFSDPAKLQSQVDLLDAHKDAALCFHVAHVIYEDGSGRQGLFPPERYLPRGVRPFYYLSDLLRHNIIQTNAVMYRWRFRNGLPDWFRADLAPGDWYWHLLHAEQGKIGFVNKAMSVYRRHQKGVYYLSEIDRLKHRAMVGMREMGVYDVLNRHFDKKFEPELLKHAYGVFMDCRRYDLERAAEEGKEPVLEKLREAYPDFARHFSL
jgi:glycosyltransferase involved in cell wall biosynthesis